MPTITTEESQVGGSGERIPAPNASPTVGQIAGLPITRNVAIASICSLAVAVLILAVSAAGVVLGSARLYGVDAKVALGATPSTAGILVPGALAQDAFTFVVGLPLLLASLLLAWRGALIGLLLWPGVLIYAL